LLIGLVFVAAGSARADSSTVLVFPFENLSVDHTLDWIGEGIAELIGERLQPEPGVYVYSREERIAAYERIGIPELSTLTRATVLKLGWDTGADQVITGTFSSVAGKFQINARLIDMEAGAAVNVNADGKLEEVIPLTMTISWQLLKKIVPGTASPESDYTARPPTPRSAFESYVRGILAQDYQKRSDLLQTAIRLYPKYGPALFQLGRTYHLQRDFATSNEWLQKLPESSPDRRQAQFLIALNCFYLGQYDRAIAVLQQLPQTYDVLLNLGAASSQKGDPTAAINIWKRAAAMDPFVSDPLFNIGFASFLKSDFDGASKNFIDSLKLRGRDSEALFLLGRVYEKQGRSEESQRLIGQAARLSQRVARSVNEPLAKLERFVTTTTFRSHDDIWNDRRLARRSRGQDIVAWLDVIQTEIDSYLFGDALRELRDFVRIFPDSSEARSLLKEVDRLQNLR
jgi:tetratricopeptide (TPR) repeat protein/TolB-like protein